MFEHNPNDALVYPEAAALSVGLFPWGNSGGNLTISDTENQLETIAKTPLSVIKIKDYSASLNSGVWITREVLDLVRLIITSFVLGIDSKKFLSIHRNLI